jgi:hypothetical protein
MMTKKNTPAAIPLYKVLVGGKSCHGGSLTWSLPRGKKPSEWHEVPGDPHLCSYGLHLTPNPAAWWKPKATAYLAEVDGPIDGDPTKDDKVAARRVRLLRKLTTEELATFGIQPTAKGAKVLPKDSDAYTILRAVWDGTPGGSRQRLNSSMLDALQLAMRAGAAFNPDDFARFSKEFRSGRWIGDIESRYAEAVGAGNTSACQAIEARVGRGPVIVNGARVHVGSRLWWDGRSVKVTSFADNTSVIACAYHMQTVKYGDHSHEEESSSIAKRYRISFDELRALERTRKAAVELHRDVGEVIRALRERGPMVPMLVIGHLWTHEQREQARVWCEAMRTHDRGKAPAAPAHVTEGASVYGREEAAAWKAWDAAENKGHVEDYLPADGALRTLFDRVRAQAEENARLVRWSR